MREVYVPRTNGVLHSSAEGFRLTARKPALSVHLTKRVQLPGVKGFQRYPVAMTANGKPRPDMVMVNGKPTRAEGGAYCLEWREGGKRVRQSVGADLQEAVRLQGQKQVQLHGAAHGVNVPLAKDSESLAAAAEEYLEEIKLTKKPKTFAAYTTALDYLRESCTVARLADLTRNDMLRFAAYLRDEKEQSPRSVYNKFENVMTFLKSRGIRGLVGKNDWPRFTEEEPEVYERAELDALLAVCTGWESLKWNFFLTTGMREQEVMHTTWANLKGNAVTVTHKPEYGWTPKAYKERTIPLPTFMIEGLKDYRKSRKDACPLLFPNGRCSPNGHYHRDLQECVERGPVKGAFYLHKFRATFATWALWGGVDLRTVQAWLGHADMESTMRYLKPSRAAHVQDKVNQIFG